MSEEGEVRGLSLEDAGKFHGHLGPFLTLGYLAGKLAVEELKPKTEFDLFARVFVPASRPYTCIVDGVQCSTQCTLGKGNIEVVDSNSFEILFENVKTGEKLSLRIREEILKEIKGFGGDMESAVDWLLRKNAKEIFQISRRYF